MQLSKNFTLKEMTKSATAQRLGISNSPKDNEVENLRKLCEKILQPLRDEYKKPIIVSSGFRGDKLNKAVGGSPTSEHRYGMAADIHSISDTKEDNKEIFDLIVKMDLPYGQLINEFNYDWIHVSYNPTRKRHEKLEALKNNGKTVYKYIK